MGVDIRARVKSIVVSCHELMQEGDIEGLNKKADGMVNNISQYHFIEVLALLRTTYPASDQICNWDDLLKEAHKKCQELGLDTEQELVGLNRW